MKKYFLVTLTISLALLISAGFLIFLESRFPALQIPRMVVGSIVVLLLPGYWITRWTFPHTNRERFIDPTNEEMTLPKKDEPINTIDGLER